METIIAGKMHFKSTEYLRNKVRLELCAEVLRKKTSVFRPNLIICEGVFAGCVALFTVEDGVPVITDVHSVVSVQYEGDTLGKVVKERLNYLRDLERAVFEGSSGLIVISNPMKTYVIGRYDVRNSRVYVIPNGSDVRREVSEYREPLRAVFGGIFTYWENIDSFLDLAKLNKRALFYLAGDGPLKKHILKRIREEMLEVKYLGYLRHKDAIAEFSKMNVGIAPAVKTVNISFAYPIKVFDYLSCGLPVITPDFGEWAKVISKNRCGLVTKSSSANEFDECLNSFDRSTWEEMSSNGLRVIRDQFNWNLLLSRMDEVIQACQ
jgi:glycosyltransferase involved in cell wall biosynthesis